VTDRQFYVGPIGSLLPLPDVEAAPDAPLTRWGGGGRTLLGQEWRDTLSYSRTWTWAAANLLARQTAYVDALQTGVVRGPLRLIDPRRANRLPRRVSVAGAIGRSSSQFAVSVGGLYYRDITTVPAALSSLPPAPAMSGAIEWQRPQGGAGTLYLPGPGYDGTWRLPLLAPNIAQEDIELSCWVTGASGLVVEMQWTEYEITEAAHPYFSSTAPARAVTLNPSVWQRVSVLVSPYARPTSVALTPRLVTAAGAPVGSVYSTAWQASNPLAELEDAATAVMCDIPDQLGGWRVGGGAPQVVVDPGGASYPYPGFYNAAITLTETI
jgi:hypothetical protein